MAPPQVSTTIVRADSTSTVLQACADPICREILGATAERSMTAAELAETTGSAISTVYRKLDQLIDTPLLEASYRLEPDGKHPRQYRTAYDRVRLRLAEDGDRTLTVFV